MKIMPTTNRRGFLTTLLAGLGLAKHVAPSAQKVEPRIGYFTGVDVAISASERTVIIIMEPRRFGPMIPFHETHAQYMKLVKSPEYQNRPIEFVGWAKK
jgi:hypothetical protein